jgi:hypothetical protein
MVKDFTSAQQGDKPEPMSSDLLLRGQPAKFSCHGSGYLWRWANNKDPQ